MPSSEQFQKEGVYKVYEDLFRNLYRIEEGTYVNSSLYSRAGLDHKNDDWLNLIGFGNKIFEYIGNIKTAISKKLIDIA